MDVGGVEDGDGVDGRDADWRARGAGQRGHVRAVNPATGRELEPEFGGGTRRMWTRRARWRRRRSMSIAG